MHLLTVERADACGEGRFLNRQETPIVKVDVHAPIFYFPKNIKLMNTVKRSLTKTISWRIVGSIDTMIITYIITGNWKFGLAVGSVEVMTKIVLYYIHERVWERIKWGKHD